MGTFPDTGALFLQKLPALLGGRPQTLGSPGSSHAHPVSREMAGRSQIPSAAFVCSGPFLPSPCLGLRLFALGAGLRECFGLRNLEEGRRWTVEGMVLAAPRALVGSCPSVVIYLDQTRLFCHRTVSFSIRAPCIVSTSDGHHLQGSSPRTWGAPGWEWADSLASCVTLDKSYSCSGLVFLCGMKRSLKNPLGRPCPVIMPGDCVWPLHQLGRCSEVTWCEAGSFLAPGFLCKFCLFWVFNMVRKVRWREMSGFDRS